MNEETRGYLMRHRAHDAAHLLGRWRRALRGSGWRVTEVTRTGDFPVLACESRSGTPPSLYISSGIHGDEPAAPWGLLEWFEAERHWLRAHDIVILPCLNPAGLLANTRANGHGEDLNRKFHDSDHPFVAAWRRFLAGRRFQLAVCLHEDYEAQGIYVYELYRGRRPPLGPRLLDEAAMIIPLDSRSPIDGRRARGAVIRRSRIPPDLPGHAEGIALFNDCADQTLTFETPSEFSFHDRVQAHRAFLRSVAEEVFGSGPNLPIGQRR